MADKIDSDLIKTKWLLKYAEDEIENYKKRSEAWAQGNIPSISEIIGLQRLHISHRMTIDNISYRKMEHNINILTVEKQDTYTSKRKYWTEVLSGGAALAGGIAGIGAAGLSIYGLKVGSEAIGKIGSQIDNGSKAVTGLSQASTNVGNVTESANNSKHTAIDKEKDQLNRLAENLRGSQRQANSQVESSSNAEVKSHQIKAEQMTAAINKF